MCPVRGPGGRFLPEGVRSTAPPPPPVKKCQQIMFIVEEAPEAEGNDRQVQKALQVKEQQQDKEVGQRKVVCTKMDARGQDAQ